MTRFKGVGYWTVAGLALALAAGCTPGGVGDPCIPEDEYSDTFNGFQVTETNVESRSFQCETRVCLVNHFQGRVSCLLGQTKEEAETAPQCAIPGTQVQADPGHPDNIKVQVPSQLVSRQADDAVYCSCRCDGPDPNARYCECPEGFTCEKLVDDLKLGGGQLAGSYCIRNDTRYQPGSQGETCRDKPMDCDLD